MTAHVVTNEDLGANTTERYKSSSSRSSRSRSRSRRPKNPRVNRKFDPSRYATRLIALKFAYLGQRYNGLEYHTKNTTPLPTIEEELWKALNKARLIFPTPNPLISDGEVNWEGCDFSKSGRTDKGVSAFGQVIGIRVRSNRPVNRVQSKEQGQIQQGVGSGNDIEIAALPLGSGDHQISSSPPLANSWSEESLSFDHINDEIPYCQVLNRLLPPDIRILAWCPSPPTDFSARFSCKERRYRYFFTNPAFTPTHGSAGLTEYAAVRTASGRCKREGWLDIEAMREGAKKFVGLHDFRNFCKLDASKQIDNFQRRIFHADIEEVDPRTGPAGYIRLLGFEEYENMHRSTQKGGTDLTHTPKIYTFTLHGSAFLWHQVRHMVAILFIIGQGLESPDLIDELLDAQKTPGKPMYEMAEDAPLVLWDCIFPREGSNSREDALDWICVGDDTGQENGIAATSGGKGNGKHGSGGVVDDLWKVWRQRKIDEVLAGSLLDLVAEQGNRDGGNAISASNGNTSKADIRSFSQKVFHGGNGPRLVGRYLPILQKPRMHNVEYLNARFAKRKGFELHREAKEMGFRTVMNDIVDEVVE